MNAQQLRISVAGMPGKQGVSKAGLTESRFQALGPPLVSSPHAPYVRLEVKQRRMFELDLRTSADLRRAKAE